MRLVSCGMLVSSKQGNRQKGIFLVCDNIIIRGDNDGLHMYHVRLSSNECRSNVFPFCKSECGTPGALIKQVQLRQHLLLFDHNNIVLFVV